MPAPDAIKSVIIFKNCSTSFLISTLFIYFCIFLGEGVQNTCTTSSLTFGTSHSLLTRLPSSTSAPVALGCCSFYKQEEKSQQETKKQWNSLHLPFFPSWSSFISFPNMSLIHNWYWMSRRLKFVKTEIVAVPTDATCLVMNWELIRLRNRCLRKGKSA